MFLKKNSGISLVESLFAISLAMVMYTYGLYRYNDYVESNSSQKESKRLTQYRENLIDVFRNDYDFIEVRVIIDEGNQNSTDINVKRNDFVSQTIFKNFDGLKNNTYWGGDFKLNSDINSIYFEYNNIPVSICRKIVNNEITDSINSQKWSYISSDSLPKTDININNVVDIKRRICNSPNNGRFVDTLSFYVGEENF